jgi:formiminotetrahydrofolate cyclodeaminase
VRKLPVDSIEREERMPQLVLACIRVPQAIGATAVAILRVSDEVVEIVNPWLLSDLAVCGDLAMATARSAVYNVRVNLSSLTNPADVETLESETDAMLSHAKSLIQQVSQRIWSRHAAANRK